MSEQKTTEEKKREFTHECEYCEKDFICPRPSRFDGQSLSIPTCGCMYMVFGEAEAEPSAIVNLITGFYCGRSCLNTRLQDNGIMDTDSESE